MAKRILPEAPLAAAAAKIEDPEEELKQLRAAAQLYAAVIDRLLEQVRTTRKLQRIPGKDRHRFPTPDD